MKNKSTLNQLLLEQLESRILYSVAPVDVPIPTAPEIPQEAIADHVAPVSNSPSPESTSSPASTIAPIESQSVEVVFHSRSDVKEAVKPGFEAFESQKTGLPPEGLDYIPHFITETRFWTNLTGVEWVGGKPIPDFAGSFDDVVWGPGSITRSSTGPGHSEIDPVEEGEGLSGGHRGHKKTPYGMSLFGFFGSDPTFETSPEEEGGNRTATFTGGFEKYLGAYGTQYAAPLGFGTLSGFMTNEFTTEDNIRRVSELPFEAGDLIQNGSLTASVSLPGLSIGGGHRPAYEAVARVSRLLYEFDAPHDFLHVSIFQPGDGSEYLVELQEGDGDLPINPVVGNTSLFWVDYEPVTDLNGIVRIPSSNEVSQLIFRVRSSEAAKSAIPLEDISAFVGSNELQVEWDKSSGEIRVLVDREVERELKQAAEDLTITVKGVPIWQKSVASTAYEIPDRTFHIQATAFIPYSTLTIVPPEVALAIPGGKMATKLVGIGDSREFEFDNDAFRIRQDITVNYRDGIFSIDDRSPVPSNSPVGYLGDDGKITPLLEGRNPWRINEINLSGANNERAIVNMRASAGTSWGSEALADMSDFYSELIGTDIVFSPAIDWNYQIIMDVANNRAKILGGNDNYPAYEVYINGEAAHLSSPSENDVWQLLGGADEVAAESDWMYFD